MSHCRNAWIFGRLLAVCLGAACVILAARPGLAEPGQELRAALDKLQRASLEVRTVSAAFVQEKRLAVFDETLVSKGRLALKKPDKLRWEHLTPGRSGFSLNAGKIKRWNEFSGQIESQGGGQDAALKVVAEQLLAWGKVDVERLQAGFEFSLVSPDPVTLRLVPKPEPLRKLIEYIQIEFSADGRYAQSVELREKDGDFTSIRYQDVELNKPLDDSLF